MEKALNILLLLMGLTTLLATWPAAAADLAREARIAGQISDAILDGEPLWLSADGNRFLAIYTTADPGLSRGGVILLHGRDAHPDWPEVIYPLRTALPGLGWATLSIQLPVNAPAAPAGAWRADIPLALSRIRAAVTWLTGRGVDAPILISHSLGARIGAEYLGGLHGAPAPSRGLVAIGLTANPADTDRGTLKALRQLQVPMLDLFGTEDFGGVIHSADARRRAARDTPYTQLQVAGADHFFSGQDEQLIATVGAWLATVGAPGTPSD